MHLDLRKPIGLLFTLYGVILLLYGWLGHRAPEARSNQLGLDLVWGAILLLFGAGLLWLVRRLSLPTKPHE